MAVTKPNYSLEEALAGHGLIAGVDEAGRGPWAGPVVAGAVILRADNIPDGIFDSKVIKHSVREILYTQICDKALTYAVGIATVEEIDQLNILGATKLAMRRAVEKLSPCASFALVDGNQPPKLPCPLQCVVKGDSRSLSIAAASILAKVTRDRIMAELACEFPDYGFERHKGYGTAAHQQALLNHGITPHHRSSFSPIRKLLEAAA